MNESTEDTSSVEEHIESSESEDELTKKPYREVKTEVIEPQLSYKDILVHNVIVSV